MDADIDIRTAPWLDGFDSHDDEDRIDVVIWHRPGAGKTTLPMSTKEAEQFIAGLQSCVDHQRSKRS